MTSKSETKPEFSIECLPEQTEIGESARITELAENYLDSLGVTKSIVDEIRESMHPHPSHPLEPEHSEAAVRIVPSLEANRRLGTGDEPALADNFTFWLNLEVSPRIPFFKPSSIRNEKGQKPYWVQESIHHTRLSMWESGEITHSEDLSVKVTSLNSDQKEAVKKLYEVLREYFCDYPLRPDSEIV